MIQEAQPFIVTLVPEPTRTVTLADLLIGSLGLAGALVVGAAFLGAVAAVGLIIWRKWHPVEDSRMPSITPITPLQPPSSPAR